MISITLVWFCLKRMPRILMLIFLIIVVFLLSFLLLGCSSSSATYATTFLIKYKFNKDSTIYPLIKQSYSNKNMTGYEDMVVKASYMNICLEVNDLISCASRKNLTRFNELSGVNIYTTNSNSSSTTLNLVQLGSDFSNKVVHQYVLIATIILSIFLFLTLFYMIVPGLPWKLHLNKFNLVLAPTLTLLWGLGSMWVHVAANAGEALVESASMGMIAADVGKKAAAMTWTPFVFMIIVSIGVIALHLRDLHQIIEDTETKV